MKRVYLLGFLLMMSILMVAITCKQSMKKEVKTVPVVDLNRYIGKWYEIARFDHPFERGLQATTAEYAFRKDGKISVTNSGHVGSPQGKLKVAHGKAKLPNPNEPGKLKVAFFLWFYADYYILELDEENYSYALIGSSTDKYLWILSRTPKRDYEVLHRLLKKAESLGYDTDKLILVEH